MSKGTTLRNVRVSDELWDRAKGKAEQEGRNLSEVIREALQAYVDGE
jgi:predicted DNA-binding protein